jgi:hypothetical protein
MGSSRARSFVLVAEKPSELEASCLEQSQGLQRNSSGSDSFDVGIERSCATETHPNNFGMQFAYFGHRRCASVARLAVVVAKKSGASR